MRETRTNTSTSPRLFVDNFIRKILQMYLRQGERGFGFEVVDRPAGWFGDPGFVCWFGHRCSASGTGAFL